MRNEKFKLNRPLTPEERASEYHKQRNIPLKTTYLEDGGTVIRLNSTYLETADRGYKQRGEDSFIRLSLLSLLLIFFILMLIKKPEHLMTYLFIPFIIYIIYDLFKEMFSYTHYPIRFNRKTRMVYVFQPDGKILSAPWDKIHFCSGRCTYMAGVKEWDIRGHLLADDKRTVIGSFTLGDCFLVKPYVDSYWEFIRRYMEQGPEAVKDAVKYCLPIEYKRESYSFSLKVMIETINLKTFFIYGWIARFFPFLFSFGRYAAMCTSKTPVWPEEINQACQIDPNDPVNLTDKDNPQWSWKKGWLFTHKGIDK